MCPPGKRDASNLPVLQASAVSHQLETATAASGHRRAKRSDSNSAGIAIIDASRPEFDSDPADPRRVTQAPTRALSRPPL